MIAKNKQATYTVRVSCALVNDENDRYCYFSLVILYLCHYIIKMLSYLTFSLYFFAVLERINRKIARIYKKKKMQNVFEIDDNNVIYKDVVIIGEYTSFLEPYQEI